MALAIHVTCLCYISTIQWLCINKNDHLVKSVGNKIWGVIKFQCYLENGLMTYHSHLQTLEAGITKNIHWQDIRQVAIFKPSARPQIPTRVKTSKKKQDTSP